MNIDTSEEQEVKPKKSGVSAGRKNWQRCCLRSLLALHVPESHNRYNYKRQEHSFPFKLVSKGIFDGKIAAYELHAQRPTVPSETFKVCLPRSIETELDNRFLSVRSNTERNLARSADLVLVCRESADSKIAEFIEPPRDQTSCHCYQQLRGTIRPPHRAGHHKLFSGVFEDAPHQICTKILSVR